jgi:DNA polymerase IV
MLVRMNDRIIFHLDMDAFFASVEIVRNPSLKGKPVIVGGNPDRRGVVSTCSYEARKFGVHSAMPLAEAKKRCPRGIFLEGNFSLYRDYSNQVMLLLESIFDCIEVVSIDEAYMDASEIAEQYQGAFVLGRLIRKLVFEKTLLTCSVGIGSNKLIAKIASSFAKPNGLFEVPSGKEAEFLALLPIESIPGIGSKTQSILNDHGIKIIQDLQNLGLETLIERYGTSGYYFYMAAIGKDNRPVETEGQPRKSIGAETTFEVDQHDKQLLELTLKQLFVKSYQRMLNQQMRARGVSIKLRFSNFRTITRGCTLETHSNNFDYLLNSLMELFERFYEEGTPLRLVGITLEKLTNGYWQPTFWDWQNENFKN